MDFIHFIKTILGILPFLILCLAGSKINLTKANRSRQFLMPVIALIYSIVGVLLLERINTLLFQLFHWLGEHLTFLQIVSWQAIATFVLNAALMLGFVVIKSVLLTILNPIWKSDKISEVNSGWFY